MPTAGPFEYDVFLSYSHKDEAWVHHELLPRLRQARVGRRKLKVCIDTESFVGGKTLVDEMTRCVRRSATEVAVLTPDYLVSGWADFEVTLRRTIDIEERLYRVVPIMLRTCPVPEKLSGLVYIDFTDPARFDASLDRLLRALRATGVMQEERGGVLADTCPRKPVQNLEPRPDSEPLHKQAHVPPSGSLPEGETGSWGVTRTMLATATAVLSGIAATFMVDELSIRHMLFHLQMVLLLSLGLLVAAAATLSLWAQARRWLPAGRRAHPAVATAVLATPVLAQALLSILDMNNVRQVALAALVVEMMLVARWVAIARRSGEVDPLMRATVPKAAFLMGLLLVCLVLQYFYPSLLSRKLDVSLESRTLDGQSSPATLAVLARVHNVGPVTLRGFLAMFEVSSRDQPNGAEYTTYITYTDRVEVGDSAVIEWTDLDSPTMDRVGTWLFTAKIDLLETREVDYQVDASTYIRSLLITFPSGLTTPTPEPVPSITTPPLAPEPTLGATRTLTTDGSLLVYVPSGPFSMGSAITDVWGTNDERPQHSVFLDGFWIGRTEVTNAQFGAFIDAGGYSRPDWWTREGWDWRVSHSATKPGWWTDDQFNGADYPVIGVNWHEACAYAKWAGARLPTEAEWEEAARGTDGRVWPWGDTWDPGRLNFCDRNCDQAWRNAEAEDGFALTAPTGHYLLGESPCGALDLAGNVWEWVADWYHAEYYTESAQANPTGPASGTRRVVRGGSWFSGRADARTAYRGRLDPTGRYNHVGFRIALSATK